MSAPLARELSLPWQRACTLMDTTETVERAKDLRDAALTFPYDTGLGADNISPRALARLSDCALKALAKIFCAVLLQGSWPAVLELVLIVLLPKADGGRRPIGLLPTVVRGP